MSPETERQIADAIQTARNRIKITGGGTRGYARHVQGDVLSTSAHSGITLYEPGALTIVAKSGTPLAEIEQVLADQGQMLAFEPMDHRAMLGTTGTPTIGGVVAANVSGPRRISAVGSCRDSLLGVRFVDGAGTLVKNGGRVMKNVTGYDLVKLMAGSFGTLGVLTEVSLKVLPLPAAVATVTLDDLSPDQAVTAMSAALSTPYEVTGTWFGPYHYQTPRKLHLRLEGAAESVSYRAQALAKQLDPFGQAQISSDTEVNRALWADIRDATHLRDQSFVARISLQPSTAARFVEGIGKTLHSRMDLDWSGGLIWCSASDDDLIQNGQLTGQPVHSDARIDGSEMLFENLQGTAGLQGAHATLVKAPASMSARSVFQPKPPALAKIEAAIRAKFDPRGILNQGLMG